MFAHLVREVDVVFINREVDDRTVATDVENRVVGREVHVLKLLCAGELGFDRVVFEETDTLVIGEALYEGVNCVLLKSAALVSTHLDAVMVDRRIWSFRGGEVYVNVGCEDCPKIRQVRQSG